MIQNRLPLLYDGSLVTREQWAYILDFTLKHGLREGAGLQGVFWRVPSASVSSIMQLGEHSEIDQRLAHELDTWVEGARKVCEVVLTDTIIDLWPMICEQLQALHRDPHSLLLLAATEA